ncbi:hypothetical protein KEF85_13985 [Methylomonas paludis]|uniref:Uncharacterized protein n=1 Tax=Methylomonas paludis TaxID=1173101 RepID=A0A975MN84_9GAMM|nr:hypothetical protein [Methylomonas paludis]QWF70434.1 hypothetical protein KEF85_13985 [Methylomonas paludis]
MKNSQILIYRIKLILLSSLLSGISLAPAEAASATATAIFGNFSSEGLTTTTGLIGTVQNSSAPFNNPKYLAHFNKSVGLLPHYPTPTLTVTANGIRSKIFSSGIQIDTASTLADSAIDNTVISLALNPPPPTKSAQLYPQPFLQITVNRLSSSSSFNRVFPNFTTPTGDTNIGFLQLSGSLINSKTPLQYKGHPSKDYVLFQNQQLTVTLNRQLIAALVSCTVGPSSGGCQTTAESITTDAINISITNAEIDGQAVSGEINIGHTFAE